MTDPRPGPGRRALSLLVAALVFAACSGGDKEGGGEGKDGGEPTTSTEPAPQSDVSLELGAATVHSAGPEGVTLDDATGRAVFERVTEYVDTALVQPLLSGEPAADLESLFTAALAPRVAPGQPDRAALTDEEVGPVTADVVIGTDDPVTLDALMGADGAIVLVAATVTLRADTETAEGPLQINRRAELTFERGEGDTWLVTAYRVLVGRETPAGTSSETATTGTGAATTGSTEAP